MVGLKRPDDQPDGPKRPALALDFETILAINSYLENLGSDIDNLHGRISLDIVKGKFQRIEVTSSYLLISNKKKRQTA